MAWAVRVGDEGLSIPTQTVGEAIGRRKVRPLKHASIMLLLLSAGLS